MILSCRNVEIPSVCGTCDPLLRSFTFELPKRDVIQKLSRSQLVGVDVGLGVRVSRDIRRYPVNISNTGVNTKIIIQRINDCNG